MGLIDRQMFAIDGVKLPANASKERSGTRAELRHRAARLDQAAAKIVALHQSQDDAGQDSTDLSVRHQERIAALHKEAQSTRDFIACNQPRLNRKGQELKTNIPALIADNQMRKRDERYQDQAKHKAKPDPLADKRASSRQAPIRLYKPADFQYHAPTNSCICPQGEHLYSNGNHCVVRGKVPHRFTGAKQSCVPCQHRDQCLRKPQSTQVRHVSIFAKNQPGAHAATQLMKQAIDSARGRQLQSPRIGTVEPVFANIRHNKRLNRFTLRGKAKVNAQWSLYCLVHNIEKLANHGYAQ